MPSEGGLTMTSRDIGAGAKADNTVTIHNTVRERQGAWRHQVHALDLRLQGTAHGDATRTGQLAHIPRGMVIPCCMAEAIRHPLSEKFGKGQGHDTRAGALGPGEPGITTQSA